MAATHRLPTMDKLKYRIGDASETSVKILLEVNSKIRGTKLNVSITD
jgi:hypothetical protein